LSEDREIERTILEERRIARAMEAVYREIMTLEKGILERQNASSAIDEDLKRPSAEKDLLVPIGGDVFLYATLQPRDRVLINVGADVYMSRSRQEAKEFLEKRTSLFEKAHRERLTLFDNLKRRRDEMNALILDHQIDMEKRRREVEGA
jgi:prefoldin alpha subunit